MRYLGFCVLALAAGCARLGYSTGTDGHPPGDGGADRALLADGPADARQDLPAVRVEGGVVDARRTDRAPCIVDKDCDDSLACTADRCLPGSCAHDISAGFCLIGGQCVAGNALNPKNKCQRCLPTSSPSAWTNTKDACDDGVLCTSSDVCANGVCAGTPYTCPSSSCATGACTGKAGADSCTLSLKSGWCLIGDGSCFADGATSPLDVCAYCKSGASTKAWTLTPACVATLAGSGIVGSSDGAALSAQLNGPAALVYVDPASPRFYVADTGNHRIRKLYSGQLGTIVGSTAGFVSGPAATARFNQPRGLVHDATANKLYVADSGNHAIRVVDLSASSQVSTLAGDGTPGFADGTGSAARFNQPSGLALSNGKLYVADTGNHRIRVIDLSSGVTTLAGDGTAGFLDGNGATAQFQHPSAVVVATNGALYVADRSNHRIRAVLMTNPSAAVSTVAGAGGAGALDGPALSAQFNQPQGLALDGTTLYVADGGNHRIRTINLATAQVSTLAGTIAGFADGAALSAKFSYPEGLTVGPSKRLAVADPGNHRLRLVTPP